MTVDIGPEKKLKGAPGTTEDYVEFAEFRLMCAYLCVYAAMFDAFALIDGGSAGTTKDDDRRISLAEWTAGAGKVRNSGFVGLAHIGSDPASLKATFSEMDADGKGMVLLTEWCNWLENKEKQARTVIGEILAVGE